VWTVTIARGRQFLYSPEECAAATSLSRSTIYELLGSGELKSIRIGRARRIPAEALEQWLADKQTAEAGTSAAHEVRRATASPRPAG
jgi:excisionase family DNA binding protein